MSGVHNVFHISILRKYVHADTHVIDFHNIKVNDNISYEERLMYILDYGTKKLRNKEIPLVKVQWTHHNAEEAS